MCLSRLITTMQYNRDALLLTWPQKDTSQIIINVYMLAFQTTYILFVLDEKTTTNKILQHHKSRKNLRLNYSIQFSINHLHFLLCANKQDVWLPAQGNMFVSFQFPASSDSNMITPNYHLDDKENANIPNSRSTNFIYQLQQAGDLSSQMNTFHVFPF